MPKSIHLYQKKVKVPIMCYCGSPEFKIIPWTLVGKYKKNFCLLTTMLSMLIKDEKKTVLMLTQKKCFLSQFFMNIKKGIKYKVYKYNKKMNSKPNSF